MNEVLLTTHLSAEQREYLRIQKRVGETLLNLVNNILDYSRTSQEDMVLNSELFSIADVFKQIEEIFSVQALGKQIQLDLELDERLKKDVIGDSLRLTQILSNLVSNSIKFTDEGSISIKANFPGKTDSSLKIQFIVEDTGSGISEKKLKTIFNPYEQENSQIVQRHGGFGLGLSIVKNLVELMDGNIKVRSEVDKGSVFTFEIPFELPTESELKTSKTFIPINKVDSSEFEKPYKILVADDDINNHLLIKAYTRDTSLRIDFVENGKIAYDLFCINKYDLLIIDFQMPKMSGTKCIQKIRQFEEEKNKKYTPAIAFTANVFKSQVDECLKAGFDNFMAKPVKKIFFINMIYKSISWGKKSEQ